MATPVGESETFLRQNFRQYCRCGAIPPGKDEIFRDVDEDTTRRVAHL